MGDKVRAIFEFWAENEAELSFQVGDVISVLSRDESEGWWEGELNGQRGLFPSNYVEPVSSDAVSPTASAPPSRPVGGRASASRPATSAQPASPSGNAATGPSKLRGKAEHKVDMPAAASSSSSSSAAAPSASPPAVTGTSHTKFGIWASNMAFYSAISMVFFGIMGFIWYAQDTDPAPIVNQPVTLWASVYSFILGFIIYAYEYVYGRARGASPIPVRGLVYTILSIFLFFSWPTLLAGFFLITAGITNFIATAMGEVYDAPPPARAKSKTLSIEELQAEGIGGAIKIYFASIHQQNKVGQFCLLLAYVAANIGLFAHTVKIWEDKVATAKAAFNDDPELVPSDWTPYAKGFGALLDLNCVIILLPVLRTIIRALYNRSTADQGWVAGALRGALYFFPLDQNLKFHKAIAAVIMGATIMHTLCHYINFAVRPIAVLNTFADSWPLISGGIVCYCMFFIYTAAFDNTKRGQFELFWYSHHVFIAFFFFLLVHGKKGLNPNFWKYFIGPGVLYLLERLLRIYRARLKVVVLSCTVMGDVFSLEFAKEGIFANPYKEGQYVFICSPPISKIQWHPFTISSAPEEKTVTVHVRVCGEGSWTRELFQYISAMGPRGKPFFALDRQGPQGKVAGKIVGPDGQTMLCLDGPHSAPTQHVSEYAVAMVIGAGIGATPVSASLKSVVFHRWKYFIGQCYPDHAYFMWVCAHRDIDAFRWLIRIIKDAQDEVIHMRANNPAAMASKTFEFHIFVTSLPKTAKPIDVIVGEEDEIGFWGVPREEAKLEKVRASWDEADLYKTMHCPTQKHKQMQDIHVWSGRPDWSPHFHAIGSKHPEASIGVAFCGNPMIASDLKKQCFINNKNRTNGFFKLHKENF